MGVKKQKVIVAMSGGIDSSVAAALLKRAGFNVIGVHMKFWSEGTKSGNKCCTPESEKKARQVSKKLGIPFYVFNFEKEFKKRIVDYFLKEYKAGRTPNPCVVCNKEIKFGLLLKKALQLGADYVATGHYARISTNSELFTNKRIKIDCGFVNSRQIRYSLISAKDKEKDQSYFLWQLSQKQLKHILFPVGGYTKDEVRALAKKFKLPVAKTPESQEVCFIQTTINDFLKKYLSTRTGLVVDVVDKRGKVLGKHQGLWFYTIGQRKGIKLLQGPSLQCLLAGKPVYVVRKDVKKNRLVVTQNKKDLLKKELVVKSVNWVSGDKPKLPIKASVKIRYRSRSAPAIMRQENEKGMSKIKIVFQKPQRAITPGQSAVFYKGKEMLGGGIIC